tara:strand:- start:240 stop:437 length:198 start_codon:yes stop_codon:yes gene_type:complete
MQLQLLEQGVPVVVVILVQEEVEEVEEVEMDLLKVVVDQQAELTLVVEVVEVLRQEADQCQEAQE